MLLGNHNRPQTLIGKANGKFEMRKTKLVLGLWAAAAMSALSAPSLAEDADEQPTYQTEMEEGRFEVRTYDPMLVAEVTHRGARSRALNAGFRRLAAYIFAQERPGRDHSETQSEPIAMTSPVIVDEAEEIAMTSPVMQDPGREGAWRTRFVMPRKYTLETLPKAAEDITLTEVAARRMAVIRFAGYGSNRNLAVAEEALRDWMAEQGLEPIGAPEYAFYDSPMVPPQYRRNEVLIPVAE